MFFRKLTLILDAKYWLLILQLILLCASVEAKKPDVKSEVAQVTISGYIQTQFRTTIDDNTGSESTFKINHALFQIDSQLTNALSAKIEIDALTDYVGANDICLEYKLFQIFSLKAGQMKKPFSISHIETPRKMIMIDRPFYYQDDFEDYMGRDIGLTAKLDIHKQLSFLFGVFNGSGSGVDATTDDDNTKDFTARTEYKPIECLKMSFNVSSCGLTNKKNEIKRKNAYGTDISINHDKFRIVTEGIFGDNPNFNKDVKMLGLYWTIAYKRKFEISSAIKHGEIGGRIEYINTDRTSSENAITSITPYIGVYFNSNANLKICPAMRFPKQGDKITEFIMQAQTEF